MDSRRPKKQRKKLSWDDAAFNPKRPHQKDKRKPPHTNINNIAAMRADTKMEYGDKPLKVVVVIHEEKIEATLDANFKENLANEFAKVPGNRPGKVTKTSAITDSPLEAETPGGSTVHLTSRLGLLRFLTNQLSESLEKLKLQESITNADFYNSPQYKQITEALDNYKKQSIVIKSDSHQKPVATVPKKSNKAIMGVAATEYVKSTRAKEDNVNLFNGPLKCEWLHLVARMFSPVLGNKADDIVAGTDHANTEMLLVESQLKFLANKYPEGVHLEVSATLIPGTHIAKNILFKVITKDFSLPFEFNAQTTIQPHITYQNYIKCFLEELVKQAENKEDSIATPFKVTPTSAPDHTLFKKPASKKDPVIVEEKQESSKKSNR